MYYSRLITGHVFPFIAFSMHILSNMYIYIHTYISITRTVFIETCIYLKPILKNLLYKYKNMNTTMIVETM